MSARDIKKTVADWLASIEAPGRPNEREGKVLLKGLGIPVPRGFYVRPGREGEEAADLKDAVRSAGISQGAAFVVKVCSGEILHKTDQGGVILGLQEKDLPEAAEDMRRRFPGSGILIEEMAEYKGTEIIIGALYDSTFGPAVMAGAGGILTELYNDVSFRLAPFSLEEAGRMLSELTVYPALEGYRGLPADLDSLIGILQTVSLLAVHLIGEGCQLDINPLVLSGGRWMALDAKVVLP